MSAASMARTISSARNLVESDGELSSSPSRWCRRHVDLGDQSADFSPRRLVHRVERAAIAEKLNSASDERAASRTSGARMVEERDEPFHGVGDAAVAQLFGCDGLDSRVGVVEGGEDERVTCRS